MDPSLLSSFASLVYPKVIPFYLYITLLILLLHQSCSEINFSCNSDTVLFLLTGLILILCDIMLGRSKDTSQGSDSETRRRVQSSPSPPMYPFGCPHILFFSFLLHYCLVIMTVEPKYVFFLCPFLRDE